MDGKTEDRPQGDAGALARAHTAAAIEALVRVIGDEKSSPAAVVAAASALLARGHGRPSVMPGLPVGKIKIEALSDEQLHALLARITVEAEGEDDSPDSGEPQAID